MVFDLDNSQWSKLIPKGRTSIDQPLDFSVCAYGKNKIVLYGREPTNDQNTRNDRDNTPRRRGSSPRNRSRSKSPSPKYRNNEPCCRILNIIEDSGPTAREIDSAPFEAEWEVFSSREMVYRQNHTAHVYGDRLIVFGGLDNRLQPMGNIVSYDLSIILYINEGRSLILLKKTQTKEIEIEIEIEIVPVHESVLIVVIDIIHEATIGKIHTE